MSATVAEQDENLEGIGLIQYVDTCACGAVWKTGEDIEISGPREITCKACKRLWAVTTRYIQKHFGARK